MLAQIDLAVLLSSLGGMFSILVGVIIWTSKTRVGNNLCSIVRETNERDHKQLRLYIKDSEQRAENRHTELKNDLNEVKNLIKNNGNPNRKE